MNPDTQAATLQPYVRRAESGNSFWYLGQLMSTLAEGEDTEGRLTVFEILFPPQLGTALARSRAGRRGLLRARGWPECPDG